MGGLYFGVGGSPVCDAFGVQEFERLNRHLVNIVPKTTNAGARSEEVKSSNLVFPRQKLDVHGIHDSTLVCESAATLMNEFYQIATEAVVAEQSYLCRFHGGVSGKYASNSVINFDSYSPA
jgi:hypothetical protein